MCHLRALDSLEQVRMEGYTLLYSFECFREGGGWRARSYTPLAFNRYNSLANAVVEQTHTERPTYVMGIYLHAYYTLYTLALTGLPLYTVHSSADLPTTVHCKSSADGQHCLLYTLVLTGLPCTVYYTL